MEDYMVSTTMTRVARITRNFGLISRPQAVRPPSSTPREKRIFRRFRYAYPSSSLRCNRKRPSLLSLACASGLLSFAVGERCYCCVYFLSAIAFHVRTYADASFHITIQARSQTPDLHTYVQSSTFVPSGGFC